MRILGVDIGTTSVKGVEIDSAFGRFEIRDYHEFRIGLGEEPKQALSNLMQSLSRKPDRIAMAMPCRTTTFRNLTVPTRNKKAIQAAINFELDDELPFPIDESVIEHSIVSVSKQMSTVHVSVAPQKHVNSFIENFRFDHKQQGESEFDPDLLTTEAWAYRTLFNRIAQHPVGRMISEQPVILVQIGHARTVIYAHNKGLPVLAKELSWGGRDLTAAISQKYSIPLDQAEQTKLDHGFVVSPFSPQDVTVEQAEFSEALSQQLKYLAHEIKQSILACKNVTKRNIGAVYIAGGTSLLPGLQQFLEDSVKAPIKPLAALSSIATSGITYSEHTDATFPLSISLALCMVGSERATSANFRKGQFLKHMRSREIDLSTIRHVGLGVSTVLLTLFISLFVQSKVYKSRSIELDAQLEKNIRSFFTNLSGSAVKTYLANTSTLKASINKELDKQRDLNRLLSPNTHSPFDFIKTISTAIPKDLIMDITMLQIGSAPTEPFTSANQSNASLTFLLSNPQTAEKLATILGTKLNDIQRGKTEEVTAPDGTGKRWKITFSGKPSEHSYGN
ncbi:MAG: pilus assembly protein PilM [Bdellovibrionota bacterium]